MASGACVPKVVRASSFALIAVLYGGDSVPGESEHKRAQEGEEISSAATLDWPFDSNHSRGHETRKDWGGQGVLFVASGNGDGINAFGGGGPTVDNIISSNERGAIAVSAERHLSDEDRWLKDVPGLSWPLPSPSARMVLPRETGAWMQKRGLRIGDIAHEVQQAMSGAGYSDRSFYPVPDGFVIVTRLEQIQQDGTPKQSSERWNVSAPGRDEPFLIRLLKGMMGATSGNYRLFIFVVSTDDSPPLGREPDYWEAKSWALRGVAQLPQETTNKPVTARHRMSVLVYEFEARRRQKVLARIPGLFSCESHLEKARLWDGLSKLAGGDLNEFAFAASSTHE